MSRLAALLLLVLALAPIHAQDAKDAKDAAKFQIFDQPVGPFKLKERGGQFVRDRDLLGKVWVAQFFYPGCNLCSRNTPTMKKLQDHYRGKTDVRLVSIDLLDSHKNHGPETLDEFAKSYEAEPGQWLFLTGPEDTVHDIVQTSFFNMALRSKKPTLGAEIDHATHLVVIDARGTMVGYVNGVESWAADVLIEQIDQLRTRRRLEERVAVAGADLPWFNALLNSTCAVLLLLGWIAIRMRMETLHKALMLLALGVSAVFLASYLFYHFAVMGMEPTRFRGEGMVRYVYFAILTSHTLLAMAVAPLAIYIAVQGLRNSLAAHVKIARWTLPIWLYVSVTGVAVYWMLYRMEF